MFDSKTWFISLDLTLGAISTLKHIIINVSWLGCYWYVEIAFNFGYYI